MVTLGMSQTMGLCLHTNKMGTNDGCSAWVKGLPQWDDRITKRLDQRCKGQWHLLWNIYCALCPWLTGQATSGPAWNGWGPPCLSFLYPQFFSGCTKPAWKEVPKWLLRFSFPFCTKTGGGCTTLHCPGHVTSRNSYLGIGREMPRAGHLSCENKEESQNPPEVMENWVLVSFSVIENRIPPPFTPANRLIRLYAFMSHYQPHYIKTHSLYLYYICSMYRELLEDKDNILFILESSVPSPGLGK